MVKTTILQTPDTQLNAALMIALFSPTFFQDYEIREDGLHCFFSQTIYQFQEILKTFLVALYELTNTQFYFELINDNEAILKIYGTEGLKFSNELMFKSPFSYKESAPL
ncbi:MAG: hypothetical protein ACFFBQ_12125 [Promethearchaeota archaeon]